MTEGAASLDDWMAREGIKNRDMAERIQMVRRHVSRPTAAEVSHWRGGRRVPHHDMRLWIEVATAGEVVAERWEQEG